jgi:hypothetical protein
MVVRVPFVAVFLEHLNVLQFLDVRLYQLGLVRLLNRLLGILVLVLLPAEL